MDVVHNAGGRGNLRRCENPNEIVGEDEYDTVFGSQMLCSMTKQKGPSHLVALLQVPTPKDTSVPDGVLDTNSVPPLNCEPVIQPCWVNGILIGVTVRRLPWISCRS